MDRVEVAVRRPQGPDERLRVGEVLSRTGTLARVRWNDDGVVEENVRLGGENLLAVVGTRRHQFLMDLPSLIERFTADPVTVVLDLLRESPKGLKAPAIKELLVELGLDPAIVDRTWRSLQAKLARHDDVQIKANTYRWKRPGRARDTIDPSASPVPPESSAPEAPSESSAPETERKTEQETAPKAERKTAPETGRKAAPETGRKAAPKAEQETGQKAEQETGKARQETEQKPRRKTGSKDAPEGDGTTAPDGRAGLSEPSEAAEERVRALAERYEHLERDLRAADDRAIGLRTAQEHRIRLDGARALADLAAEIEEMVTAGAAPETVVGRVRDLVALQALRPIGTAGQEDGFDPGMHEPLTGTFEPGAPVRVVRPGYRWVTSEETLLHRALVERPHA